MEVRLKKPDVSGLKDYPGQSLHVTNKRNYATKQLSSLLKIMSVVSYQTYHNTSITYSLWEKRVKTRQTKKNKPLNAYWVILAILTTPSPPREVDTIIILLCNWG